jgi:hypothetical protein
MKVILAVAVMVLGLLCAMGGSYWLSVSALNRSQQNWCASLALLTANPVPRPADPKANPSREQSWEFYQSLVQLQHRFGC